MLTTHSMEEAERLCDRVMIIDHGLHQVVLLAAVLATRATQWPPELDYLAASPLAVVGSFTLAALVRLPGAARIF